MKINLDFIYPIGSIYETTSVIHPNVSLGGEWELYGAGRVTVCIDENDSDNQFATIGETGGSKYLQDHTHRKRLIWREYKNLTYGLKNSIFYSGNQAGSVEGTDVDCGNVDITSGMKVGNSGNLQPYIVVYRYRRIA